MEIGHPHVATATTAATTDVAAKTTSRDDQRRDDNPPEARREERDLPPPPETGNPNGLFQHAKRLINIIIGGMKSSTSRRRY
jgi:hypothetical protein